MPLIPGRTSSKVDLATDPGGSPASSSGSEALHRRPSRAGRSDGSWVSPLLLVLCCVQCGDSEKRSSREASTTADRELSSAYFEEGRWVEARAVLASLTTSKESTAQDFVNLACVEMWDKDGSVESARQALEQALAIDPKIASAHYCKGILSLRDLQWEKALEEFEKALQTAPDDIPLQLQYAGVLRELGRTEESMTWFQKVIDRGIEFGGSFYVTALYQMGQVLIRTGVPENIERGRELLGQHKKLLDAGFQSPSQQDLERGNLAKVTFPRPKASTPLVSRENPVLRFEEIQTGLFADAGTIHDLVAADVDGDKDVDLVAAAEKGVFIGMQQQDRSFSVSAAVPDAGARVIAASLENRREDGTRLKALCMILLANGKVDLFVPKADGYENQSSQLPADLAPVDVALVDYDHEGDVDLLCANAKGLRLLRNDGRPEKNKGPVGPFVFTEVSTETGLPQDAFAWVEIEDFDADGDIDFIAGGTDSPTVLFSSLRRGRFQPLDSKASGLPDRLERAPRFIDLDHDGRTDALVGGASPALLVNRGDGTFARVAERVDLAEMFAAGKVALEDLDCDGEVDFVGFAGDGSCSVRLGSLLLDGGALIRTPGRRVGSAAPILVDLDEDADLDLVALGSSGVSIWRNASTSGHAFALRLHGKKDNLQAIGATCELRCGTMYLRRMVRGESPTFGLRDREHPDLVTVTWPNGVVQYSIKPEEKCVTIDQKEGQVGSCPFLYSWNGERYEFISDVLGTTPLGLPMVEGKYVPPDHDELVRIEGSKLAAHAGEFRLQVTEELREVTYLDHAQLWVVDHPASTEVHPEERFTFPPFPPQRIHAIREILPVESAAGSDGKDWTKEVRSIDATYAVPFERMATQYQGLVTPHFLEIALPKEVSTANRVRLLMTGWLFWTDASVNVAAGHHPTIEFVPPMLEAPDENGGFQTKGVLGFPAGKTKTMVVDVSAWVNRADLRVRISSTLELYWDAIRISVDEPDAPVHVTKIDATCSSLYFRGFSQPVFETLEHQPERFEFEHLTARARWNQHSGMLTRYGDVLPLLQAIDDCFVLFSAGDAIDLRFDARAIEAPSEGMARTYLLHLDGWAKDADPNTTFSQTVEPLPFHGMSGYPYRDDEHYPMDDLHQSYRREWNTRPGRRLIESLTPAETPGG